MVDIYYLKRVITYLRDFSCIDAFNVFLAEYNIKTVISERTRKKQFLYSFAYTVTIMGLLFTSFITDIYALLIFLSILIITYYKRSFTYFSRKNVPHPKPSIPFGNMGTSFFHYSGQTIAKIYQDLKDSGNKFGGFYLFAKPIFILTDTELYKNILTKDFQYFHNRGSYNDEEADPLSVHLAAMEGQEWKNMRTILSPTFTSGKMKMMFPTIVACGEGFDQIMEKASKTGESIDINDIAGRYNTDVISSCAFGIECNCMKNPDAEFRRYGRKVFPVNIIDSTRFLMQMVAPALLKFFKIPGFNPEATSFFTKVVKETMEYREKNNIVRRDFMSLLIKLKNNENIDDDNLFENKKNERQQAVETLTLNQIAANAFLFFIGGFETSSTVMKFCMYELALNMDVQDKLRKEIYTTLKANGGNLTYEALIGMQYLDKVINETMRKYPPALLLNRICTKDYKIPDSDVTIDEGVSVFISVNGIHMDPEHYPDPEKFDPERFSAEETAKRHNYAYLPFGDGPRNCIAKRFGLLQTKVGIVALLMKFKYTLHPKTKLPLELITNGIMMASKEEIWLQAEKL